MTGYLSVSLRELTSKRSVRITFCFFHLFKIHIEEMAFMIWIKCPILFIDNGLLHYGNIECNSVVIMRFLRRRNTWMLSLKRSADVLKIR